MFLEEGDLSASAERPCPDTSAGLHVRTRSGTIVRVALPRDGVAFQAGECLQVASGGLLRATPHMVRAAAPCGHLSRNTFAVFLQPKCACFFLSRV